MRLILIFLIFVTSINLTKAQTNLVPNPSFENILNCNDNYYYLEELIHNWYGGKGYFNVCRTNNFSVPNNIMGNQQPYTGNAYCGIYTYLKNSYPIRQYIQTRLMDTLTAGKKYRVAFYISLGDTLHAFNNSIGAYFAADSLYTMNNFVIDAAPQIINSYANNLDNKTEWRVVCDTFVASGSESWITIGNFLNDSLSLITPLDSVCSQPLGWGCGSYYYIDDVSVTLIEETGLVNKKLNDFSIFPNPNYGTFRLLNKGTLTKSYILNITDLYGNQLDNIEIINSTTEYENARLKNGLYFYTIRQVSEELGRGKFMVID